MPIKITTTQLPEGHVGQDYRCQLKAIVDPPGAVIWAVENELPAALYLEPTEGFLTGRCAQEFLGSLEFRVRKAPTGDPVSAVLELFIAAALPLELTSRALPEGSTDEMYVAPLEASGGVLPYTWEISGLPEGLALKGNEITGTPTHGGSREVEITVRDDDDPRRSASDRFQLEVASGPLKLGDRHAGGLVFMLAPDGKSGMVVTEEDLGPPKNWQDAKDACESLQLNGFSDWQLPDREQWEAIYYNLFVGGLGGLGNRSFWTSTLWNPSSDLHVSCDLTLEGRFPPTADFLLLPVRAARSFGPPS